MFGEPNGFSGGDFLVVLAWLAGFPFMAAVVTGAVSGRLLKGTGLWPGVLMGCFIGILNPFLAFLALWMYTEEVYDHSPEMVVVSHAAGAALGCAVLVGLLYAMGRANIRAHERQQQRRQRRRPIP